MVPDSIYYVLVLVGVAAAFVLFSSIVLLVYTDIKFEDKPPSYGSIALNFGISSIALGALVLMYTPAQIGRAIGSIEFGNQLTTVAHWALYAALLVHIAAVIGMPVLAMSYFFARRRQLA